MGFFGFMSGLLNGLGEGLGKEFGKRLSGFFDNLRLGWNRRFSVPLSKIFCENIEDIDANLVKYTKSSYKNIIFAVFKAAVLACIAVFMFGFLPVFLGAGFPVHRLSDFIEQNSIAFECMFYMALIFMGLMLILYIMKIKTNITLYIEKIRIQRIYCSMNRAFTDILQIKLDKIFNNKISSEAVIEALIKCLNFLKTSIEDPSKLGRIRCGLTVPDEINSNILKSVLVYSDDRDDPVDDKEFNKYNTYARFNWRVWNKFKNKSLAKNKRLKRNANKYAHIYVGDTETLVDNKSIKDDEKDFMFMDESQREYLKFIIGNVIYVKKRGNKGEPLAILNFDSDEPNYIEENKYLEIRENHTSIYRLIASLLKISQGFRT